MLCLLLAQRRDMWELRPCQQQHGVDEIQQFLKKGGRNIAREEKDGKCEELLQSALSHLFL